MELNRSFFHGIIKTKESIYKKSIYFLGICAWKEIYLANVIEFYFLGIFKILTKSNYLTKVSILMYAYNSEKYIADAIDSILNQTFTNFEFIIINDKSRDGTEKIIRSYKDSRIFLVNNEKTQGLTRSLNMGIGLCRGEFIARMSVDGISNPARIAKQVAFMEKHPKIGILGCWYRISGNENKIVRTPKKIKLYDMRKASFICHSTAMLRKPLFDKYSLRYECGCEFNGDDELFSRAIHFMKIANLQESLQVCRENNGMETQIY